MQILAFPRYSSNGPSSRVRMYNYLPYLKDAGFKVETYPFFNPSYIDDLFSGKNKNILQIFKAYWRRIVLILKADKSQFFWLQYELLPWVPFWIEKLLLNRCNHLVIDYDDAVFDRYRNHPFFLVRWFLGNKISRLMGIASITVVGNQYLADYAHRSGASHVVVIPSVIDLEKFQPKRWEKDGGPHLRIGWIGSPSTVHYLLLIKDAILASITKGCTFTIIGADIPEPLRVVGVSSLQWTIDNEGELLHLLDVGVMPLEAASFEKGKCGYKLIQYMACGLPVVASPVGVNTQIVRHGENGYLAESESDWNKAFEELHDRELRIRMGNAGRRLVESTYNYAVQSKTLIDIFKTSFRHKKEN